MRPLLPLAAAAVLLLVAPPARAQERVGVGLDLFGEAGRMSGEQWINASRQDESFDFGLGSWSAQSYLLWRARPRLLLGPGVKFVGQHRAQQGVAYGFGWLGEGFMHAEYGVPDVVERFEAVLGARAGVVMLVPGEELREEIDRLQREGAHVWSTPRPGWLLGVAFGTRRALNDRFALRLDLTGQLEQLWLFATDERVDGLRFRKGWSTLSSRVGLTLAAELDL